jgi:putative ABC transport system permease protein
MNLTGAGEPQRIAAVSTIGSFFDVFGVHPFLGRLFDSTDARGNDRVVVLSYGFWRALTGGDRAVIGRTMQLDGGSYSIVGVMPEGFEFPRATQLWTPHPAMLGFNDRNNHCCKTVSAVARVRRGIEPARVGASLAAMMGAWREKFPEVYAMQSGAGAHAQTLTFAPLAAQMAGQLRPILIVLAAAVGLLLLIACANVASLQLMRGATRARETALRVALGASPRSVAGRVAVESLVIGLAGALLGLALGAGVIVMIPHVASWQSTVSRAISIDWHVVAFSACVGIATAVAFGLAPAIYAARVDPNTLLASSSRSASAGPSGGRFLGGAVIVQIALALMLLLACGLSVRSLQRLLAVDPGFRPEHVMRMRLALGSTHCATNASRIAFQHTLIERMRALPGAVAAATVSGGPFSYLSQAEHSMVVKAAGANEEVHTSLWIVGGDYFRAMGIPIHAGRTFETSDNAASPRVWLVDDVLAKRLFPDASAVGKEIEWPVPPAPGIVGVVGSIKKTDLAQPDEPSLYWSYAQYPQSDLSVILRTTLAAKDALPMMRAVVRDIDPDLPAFDLMPLEQGIDESLAPRRVGLDVLVAFAIVSLALAVLGIYGVLSYATTLRTREIGIRIALGAESTTVMRDVLWRGGKLVAVGVAVGVAIFVAAGRVVSSLVFGVSAHDGVAMGIGVGAIALASLAGVWLPARRAAGVEPAVALRAE